MESQLPFGSEVSGWMQFILVLAHSLVQFKAMTMTKWFTLAKNHKNCYILNILQETKLAQTSGVIGATHSLNGVHSFIQLRIVDHAPWARHWVMLVADGLETHIHPWLILEKTESGLSETVTAPELCRVLERKQAHVFGASHSVSYLALRGHLSKYMHLTGGKT